MVAKFREIAVTGLFLLAMSIIAVAQKNNPVVFAVLNDGKTIEPIAEISGKKLVPAVGGDAEEAKIRTFGNYHYRPGNMYDLIFGGRANGTVDVKGFDPNRECARNLGVVTVNSERAKLNGFVMGLATDFKPKASQKDVRRLPTPAERSEATALVKNSLAKLKYSQADIAGLKYQNLTAIDADGDGIAELVGTYYLAPKPNERLLIFFVAVKPKGGKYRYGYSNFEKFDPKSVVGDIQALDDGIYNELLLDSLDYDNDGVNEIFTYTKGFEGSNFAVLKKRGGLWVKAFEGSNYHCGF